ncbi:hypothetical protein EIMP300_02660 [Escherichia coli]|uniref:Uncharacterized protein n=1 Tax=Escherichia coli TaxID=562 RepID=A0A8S0FFR6_ECOLX|nr:hypothetical protein EIMP300_02660 [Escherichia coli]
MIDETLTALTDIKMPHYAPLAQASGSIDLNGTILPEYCCNTLVLGSGAAGWRAAVELKRQNVDVMVASSRKKPSGALPPVLVPINKRFTPRIRVQMVTIF